MVKSFKSRNWWPPQPFSNRPMSNRPEAAANLHQPMACGPTHNSGACVDDQLSKDTDEVAEMLNLLNLTTSSEHEPHRPDLSSQDPTNLAPVRHPHAAQPVEDSGANGPVASPLPLSVLAKDNDQDDMPLVSKRGACMPATITSLSCLDQAVMSSAFTTVPVRSNLGGNLRFGGLSSLSMAQTAPFKPHPSWGHQASYVLYVAVFLTPESHDVLLSMIPPKHPCMFGDHMTLAYKPGIQQVLEYPLGAEVELKVLGTATNDRVQAVIVDPPSWLPPTKSISTHITISVAVGSKAAEAGHLIADAMQHITGDGPPSPGRGGSNSTQAGAYKPLGEPLPLVGKLGVMVKAKSVSGLDLGETMVVYTIEDLDKGGYVSMCAENLELYHQQHDGVLTKQVHHNQGSPHSAYETSNSSTQRHHAPLSAGSVSSMKLPPSPVSVSPASAKVTLSPSVTTATGSWSPSSSAGPQPSLLQYQGTLGNEHPTDGVLDGNESDSSSNDSNLDAVQFKSAVHVGDYVALRPFVPASKDVRVVRGYVREYACDDTFQGDGVLVVLADNTIGFVIAVLETATTSIPHDLVSKEACTNSHRSSEHSKCKGMNLSDHATTSGSSSGTATGCGIGLVRHPSLVFGSNIDDLGDWPLSASAAATSAASTPSLVVRTAEDAQHDLQLWTEFESLQRQHGESLCSAILDSCNQDFKEAIALIKAQAAKASTSASAFATSLVAPALGEESSQAGPHEDLAQQLALSFGMSADSALQLCRLAPRASAECVVEVLLQHNGDISKAADALLSGNGGLHVHDVDSNHNSLMNRAAGDLPSGKDDTLVLNAMHLCRSFPSLTQETAKMLLLEHGGSYQKAAESVSEMQLLELEARTAASAGTSRLSQLSSGQHPHHQQASEEDQMAMLVALGLLDDTTRVMPHPAAMTGGNAAQHKLATIVPPQSPPPKHHQQCLVRSPKRAMAPTPASSGGMSNYRPLGTQGVYGSPPRLGQGRPSGKPYLPRAREQVADNAERKAKNDAKDVADRLYTKSKRLMAESEAHMTSAQALLKGGDREGYREAKQAADKARLEGRAAYDEANRLTWVANNKSVQVWTNDFHGQGTTKALNRFVDTLHSFLSMDNPGGVVYKVVTGKGKHSDDNVPKIKVNVLKYLEERAVQVRAETGKPWGVTWRIDPNNEGCVEVYIPGSENRHN